MKITWIIVTILMDIFFSNDPIANYVDKISAPSPVSKVDTFSDFEQVTLEQSQTGFWANYKSDGGRSSMEMNSARLAHLPDDIIAAAIRKSRELEQSQSLISTLRGVFAADNIDDIRSAINNCTFI